MEQLMHIKGHLMTYLSVETVHFDRVFEVQILDSSVVIGRTFHRLLFRGER